MKTATRSQFRKILAIYNNSIVIVHFTNNLAFPVPLHIFKFAFETSDMAEIKYSFSAMEHLNVFLIQLIKTTSRLKTF